MCAAAVPLGTPLPSDRRKRQGVSHPEDIYDLARAGARFVLEMDSGQSAREHGSDRARQEIRSSLSALSTRRALRELSPVWTRAARALVLSEAISANDLDAAIAEREEGEHLAQCLLRRTRVPEGVVADALARASSAPLIRLTTYPVDGEPFRSAEEAVAGTAHPVLIDDVAARAIPREIQKRHDLMLIAAWEHEGVLAMVDPGDEAGAWEAQEATGLRLTRFTVLASELRFAVERCWQPRADVNVPPIGAPKEALPFATAVGVPALFLLGAFMWWFRDALDLKHFFAIAALLCGFFFFTYALRYYVTTAAVLGAVLFGDRLRRRGIVSQAARAAANASSTAKPAAAGRKHHYRTLRGERLDEVGAIVTSAPEHIGGHRLPPERQPFISVQLAMYNERRVVDRLLTA